MIKKKEELENLKQENELLKQRLAACQAEMVELRDFKAFATSNHSNIAEEFLDIRTYGNRPEALAEDFEAAFDAVVEEYHIDVEAMAGDIQEKRDFFEMFPKLVIKK